MSQRLSHQNAAQGNASREVLFKRREGSLRLFWWVGDQNNRSNQWVKYAIFYINNRQVLIIMQKHDHHLCPSIHSQPFDSCSMARTHLETKLFPAVLWQPFQNWQKPRVTVAHKPPMTPPRTRRHVGICGGVSHSFTMFHSEYTTVIHCDWPSGCVHYHVNVPNVLNQRWRLCLSWSKTELLYSRIFCSSNAHMFFVISFR